MCCVVYYVGMEVDECVFVQWQFIIDKIDIVVVMVVFGMGINKFNVCYVVYYDVL